MNRKLKNSFQIPLILMLISIVLFSFDFYHVSKEKKEIKDTKPEGVVASSNAHDDCDSTLWNHVWDSWRLHVLKQCKVVTGVVDAMGADDDGDEHILLKLDPGQEGLVNKHNQQKKKGDLVVEVICANAINLKAAKKPCEGYINKVQLPSVGEHVKVTGSYVIDIHNGWKEIHPVSRIEELK